MIFNAYCVLNVDQILTFFWECVSEVVSCSINLYMGTVAGGGRIKHTLTHSNQTHIYIYTYIQRSIDETLNYIFIETLPCTDHLSKQKRKTTKNESSDCIQRISIGYKLKNDEK